MFGDESLINTPEGEPMVFVVLNNVDDDAFRYHVRFYSMDADHRYVASSFAGQNPEV